MISVEEVLDSLEEGMPPLQASVEDFACILHKCRKERNLTQALHLHDAYMCQSGLEVHTSLGNNLISVMVEVRSMCHAQQVFDRLVYRDECSWSLLITGYVKCGESRHALFLYQKMQDSSLHPSGYAFVALLKACTTLNDLERGRELFADIARVGLLEKDVFVGSTLVDMYAKCGSLAKAQEVFDKLPVRDVVTWTALITGYAKHGQGEEGLNCVERMQHEGISPNSFTLVCCLKVCGNIGARSKGREIHAEIATKGLENELLIGNTLIDMYARCGFLATAQEVFDKLLVRNVVSWNALITGYSEHGCGKEALNCFERMQQEDIAWDAVTLVCSLKACGSVGAAVKGQGIHAEIAKIGLETDILVGNTLVDMYAKCGSLSTAQRVFDKLPVRDVISWNVLMAGYSEHGYYEEVLYCFQQMQHERIPLDAVTFLCILKACSIVGATNKGQKIHADITRKGLERELHIGNTLVDMYAKCGLLVTAQNVFDKLPVQDVVSWTALLAGYAECGHGEEALNCVKQMQQRGISPNTFTLVCSLKSCGSLGDIDTGQEVHAEIARKGLEREGLVGNTLVNMYARCGLLVEAQEMFDKLLVREAVSWTALIAGYAEHGHNEKALNCFAEMQDKGICLDAVTLFCSLRACGSIGATNKGREIHAEMARKGFLERDILVGSTLVDMYAKWGSLAEAQEVFDKLPVQDVVSWTALIAGYTKHGCGEEALYCFEQMQREGISSDAGTLVCSLKACGSIGATVKGREIHVDIVRKGLEKELLVANTLVDMYAKCGSLIEAQEVSDKFPGRDVVWWNALIAGYAEHGHGEEALNCFEQMQDMGIPHDVVTLVCSLKACGSIAATDKGQKLHAETASKGLERELLVGNILIDMYAKCGLLAEAQTVFDKLSVQEVVSWTALIAGYADHGCGEEALDCFEQMQCKGIFRDAVTLACSLKACGSIEATAKGREIHAEIAKRGLERELRVGNILVDMYGKCGSLLEAQEVFDKILVRDVVSWNALIAAYAQIGESKNVFSSFERMLGEGIKPDLVTFVSVLNTCSHAGLVDKGQMHFEAISNDYSLIPSLEHYTCMVDLFGRAGHIDKAVAIIRKMPWHPDIVVWHTVLGACRKWGDVEFGRHAFEQAVRLDEKDVAAYVCMFNIYADAAMHEEAHKVEAMRVENRAWKKLGHCWWMEAHGVVHSRTHTNEAKVKEGRGAEESSGSHCQMKDV